MAPSFRALLSLTIRLSQPYCAWASLHVCCKCQKQSSLNRYPLAWQMQVKERLNACTLHMNVLGCRMWLLLQQWWVLLLSQLVSCFGS